MSRAFRAGRRGPTTRPRKKPDNYLSSVVLRNFKAIRKTGALRLTPLTVFIGNNGVGKPGVPSARPGFHVAGRGHAQE